MFAHRASQGTGSNSVDDSNFVSPLCSGQIESDIEAIERFIDAEAS
jgi:hypothetical protein